MLRLRIDEDTPEWSPTPDYPLQMMLNLYDLPGEAGPTERVGPYPKEAVVHHVRGYRRRGADDKDAGGPA